MTDKVYPVPAAWAERALVNASKYKSMYERSVSDPNGFWGEMGKRLEWIKPFKKVKNTSFAPGKVDIKWFEDGTLNVSANCIDRHLATRHLCLQTCIGNGHQQGSLRGRPLNYRQRQFVAGKLDHGIFRHIDEGNQTVG